MPPRRAFALGITGVTLAVVACVEERPACYEGEYIGCACEPNTSGFTAGYAVCRPELGGFGTCVCDGKTPGFDAGPTALDATTDALDADGGGKALFSACTKPDECASSNCFTFGDGRMFCTKSCTTPTDCPAPSPGCNGQGVCRPP